MQGTARSELQPPGRPHLGPALCALLAAAGLLWGVQAGVGLRLPGRLPFYAAHAMSFKVNGNAVQKVAFRAPAELPVYGSSELDIWVDNRADVFFRRRPTGFAVFPVGRGGATCLLILQKLAALGGAARGKPVVIFLSSSWFLQPSVDDRAVGANMGVAQLSAWVFGSDLDRTLKRDIARRLRSFTGELKDETLIADALQCLADPTPLNRLRFALLSPLGKLQSALLARLDYCVLLREMIFPQRRFLEEVGQDRNLPRAADGRIDWDRLIVQAEADEQAHRNEADRGAGSPRPVVADPDRDFLSRLQASREFADLALLVRVLKELRMQAFFINQPFDGTYSDSLGISPQTRRAYYERLQAALRSTGYPLRDFSEHEEDPFFFHDVDHPSAKAWIFYDREIDQFYQDRIGERADRK